MKKHLSPGKKAKQTGRWAKIMTKWLISYTARGPKWQFVSFEGPHGGEPTGEVDLIAIRKNHKPKEKAIPRGDLFDIFMIQVKGGASASRLSENEIARLERIARIYGAVPVIAKWIKGETVKFYDTSNQALNPENIF